MATELSSGRPHIIILGNEKGGTGKSTTAIHIIVSLLRAGYNVGSIDVDARQGTLTRYLENRRKYIDDHAIDLPISNHIPVYISQEKDTTLANSQEKDTFDAAIAELWNNDFIVIDTPGGNTFLSRHAHTYADTLITPLNDSFLDLDLLARVEQGTLNISKPSIYAENVWEFKKNKALNNKGSINWIVLRNRLSQLHAKNKNKMEKVLAQLSKRIGFKLVPGFSERVIFRELFTSGLTLLDLKDTGGKPLKLSHVAARHELRSLLMALELPSLRERLSKAV